MKSGRGVEEIWECGNIRIELSEPSMQAFSDYLPLHDGVWSEVKHLYYTIVVRRRGRDWFETVSEDGGTETVEGYRWKKVLSRRVCEFPALPEFKAILESIRGGIPNVSPQEIRHADGSKTRVSYVETTSFAADDLYSVARTEKDDGRIFYRISIGTSMDFDPCSDVSSVSFDAGQEDVDRLVEVIGRFFSKAVAVHNSDLRLEMKETLDSFEKVGDALHVMRRGRELDDVEKLFGRGIDSVIKSGDRVRAVFVRDGRQYDADGVVSRIEDDGLVLFGRTFPSPENSREKREFRIRMDEIGYLNREFADSDEEKRVLSCGIDEAESAFEKALNADEIDDVVSLSDEDAVRKYKWAFIDSVWLMREEHNLPFILLKKSDEDESGYGPEQRNAIAHAETAVRRIRRRLLSSRTSDSGLR